MSTSAAANAANATGTARRSSSVTSLARYAKNQHHNDEELANRSLDFCNAFWGIADGGYEVLLARIRGSIRTTEELRNFWKERAAIEEDYAKRLAKLAKQTFGRDELGELRNAIGTLRAETDQQAHAHASLVHTIRKEIEDPIAELSSKQAQFKKGPLATIERSYKTKNTQETYVKRARQKYEEDCVRINSFTAQSTLVQGRELERIQLKLEKTRQTVQSNEREYAQYARALADTTSRWEKEWKAFCDLCQDMEEERIEFLKDNIWGYANAVSTVCVQDDESCEKTRVLLEQVDPEKDVEAFVQDYTTGPQIPDPPPFIDYNSPNAAQQSARQTYRLASFSRSSNRVATAGQFLPPSSVDGEPASAGQAGVGAVGTRVEAASISRPSSAATKQTPPTVTANGGSSSSSSLPQAGPANPPQAATSKTSASSSKPSTSGSSGPIRPRTQDPLAEPIDHRAVTVLKVGEKTYPVNVGDDPQQPNANATPPASSIGDQDDPITQQMQALRNASVRNKSGPNRQSLDVVTQNQQATAGSSSSTAQPSGSLGSVRGPPSQSASPPAPTASFMRPPLSRSPSPIPVEDVVNNYQQRLPGETTRRSTSINRGRQDGPSQTGPGGQQEGHAGIGAHGRSSRSPSPMPGDNRSPSPAVFQQQQPGGHGGYNQQPAARGPLGIELDPSGQVRLDDLALRYRQQQQPQNAHYAGPGHAQQPSYDLYNNQRVANAGSYDQGQRGGYQQPATQAAPQNYYHPQQQRTVTNPPANAFPPPQQQGQPRSNPGSIGTIGSFQGAQAPPVQPPAGYNNYDPNAGYPGYHANGYQQPQPAPPKDYNNGYGHSPVKERSPSAAPPPTGQYTESGDPVLFYVKAIYDYQATIDEEFDFQAEDIIAVTATPEDGWWSGELLDERRRVHGRTIFPSNFVALLN